MMRKKKYSHSCEIGGLMPGVKRTTGKKKGLHGSKIGKKETRAIFNRYYKDQVENLYKAVLGD